MAIVHGDSRQVSDELPNLAILPMRKKDIEGVLSIEKLVHPKPWSYNVFLSEISNTKERSYSTLRLNGEIVGYSGVMYILEDAHITNIAVSPAHQGKDYGSALMFALVTEALKHGSKNLTLEVRVTNKPAQKLYTNFGFMPVGIRKGYYQENNEDAMIMWAYDIDSDQYRERIAKIASAKGLIERSKASRWF
ncbi:MAG: ribosomal protein S18-alanine N-acetyltransferase [Actinomycetota bacterium]|nr:ribosomal protein S18-alanine N-acetyltransferase [Actinomycetota bacterium]